MRSPTRTHKDLYRRTSIFIVPDQDAGRGDPARHRRRRAAKAAATATCATPTSSVPEDALLGARGGAFVIAQTRLGGGRVHHAMRTVGACQHAFDLMCQRAVSRQTRDGRLAD